MEAPLCCETRYVFLAGHVVLIVGFTFYVVGFATVGWVGASGVTLGLWSTCQDEICIGYNSSVTGWLEGSRVLLTFGLICYLLAFLLGLLFHCLSYTHCWSATGVFVTWILEILAGAGSLFSFIGVCIMGRNGERLGSLQFSFSLTATSLILIVLGAFMTGFTRKGVAGSIKNRNSIVPQTPALPLSQTQARGRLPPLPGASSGISGARAGVDNAGPQGLHLEPQSPSSQLPYFTPLGASHYPPPSSRQLQPLEHFPISQVPLPSPSAPAAEDQPPSYTEAINTGYM